MIRGILFAAMLLLTACTTTDEIIIDERGVNMSRYEEDLAQCRVYSEQVKTGEKAAKGAARRPWTRANAASIASVPSDQGP